MIADKIISTVITFVISGTLGYCVNVIKTYKSNDKTQGEAIKCLLRANIVNQYYVYKKIGEIPFYVKESLHGRDTGGNFYGFSISFHNFSVKVLF